MRSPCLCPSLCAWGRVPLGLVPGTALWWGRPENCRMLAASLASTHWMPVAHPTPPPSVTARNVPDVAMSSGGQSGPG